MLKSGGNFFYLIFFVVLKSSFCAYEQSKVDALLYDIGGKRLAGLVFALYSVKKKQTHLETIDYCKEVEQSVSREYFFRYELSKFTSREDAPAVQYYHEGHMYGDMYYKEPIAPSRKINLRKILLGKVGDENIQSSVDAICLTLMLLGEGKDVKYAHIIHEFDAELQKLTKEHLQDHAKFYRLNGFFENHYQLYNEIKCYMKAVSDKDIVDLLYTDEMLWRLALLGLSKSTIYDEPWTLQWLTSFIIGKTNPVAAYYQSILQLVFATVDERVSYYFFNGFPIRTMAMGIAVGALAYVVLRKNETAQKIAGMFAEALKIGLRDPKRGGDVYIRNTTINNSVYH